MVEVRYLSIAVNDMLLDEKKYWKLLGIFVVQTMIYYWGMLFTNGQQANQIDLHDGDYDDHK